MYCSRLNAKMMVRACLERQAVAGTRLNSFAEACLGCPEGELARGGLLNDDDIQGILTEKMEENAMAEEIKKIEAKAKTCARCKRPFLADRDHFNRDRRQKDGLKCYCKACDSKIAKKSRKNKKAASETGKADLGTRTRAAAKVKKGGKVLKVQPAGKERSRRSPADTLDLAPHVVVLDFGDYPDLLGKVGSEARLAFRPVEMQILFMISEAAGLLDDAGRE